jgi:hypothetical protein
MVAPSWDGAHWEIDSLPRASQAVENLFIRENPSWEKNPSTNKAVSAMNDRMPDRESHLGFSYVHTCPISTYKIRQEKEKESRPHFGLPRTTVILCLS